MFKILFLSWVPHHLLQLLTHAQCSFCVVFKVLTKQQGEEQKVLEQCLRIKHLVIGPGLILKRFSNSSTSWVGSYLHCIRKIYWNCILLSCQVKKKKFFSTQCYWAIAQLVSRVDAASVYNRKGQCWAQDRKEQYSVEHRAIWFQHLENGRKYCHSSSLQKRPYLGILSQNSCITGQSRTTCQT